MAEDDLTAFLQRLDRHASAGSVAPAVGRKRDDTAEPPAASSSPRHAHASAPSVAADVHLKRDAKLDGTVTLPAGHPEGTTPNPDPEERSLLDALQVFPDATIVSCSTCDGRLWRPAGDGEVCVRCHPAPQAATPAHRRRVA